MGFVADRIRSRSETHGLTDHQSLTLIELDARAGVNRWIEWVAPWGSQRRYPGRWRVVEAISGGKASAARMWLLERHVMPRDVAIRIATYIESRCDAGLKIARELREYAEKVPEQRPARGFRVVRERDGKGSEPRDGRRRK